MDESLERCVKSLEENTEDVRDEARRALLSICRNVLRSPNNYRSRELRLDDEVVVEKLLPAIGALECLFDVGYVEVCTQLRSRSSLDFYLLIIVTETAASCYMQTVTLNQY